MIEPNYETQRLEEEKELKIVLNIRDDKYIRLLDLVKEETGINKQNMIKLGCLLIFKDEQEKIKNIQKELTTQGIKIEQAGSLNKVHVTFIGKMRETIEYWRNKKNLTPHQICRMALERVYRFMTRENEDKEIAIPKEESEDIVESKESLGNFLNKKESIIKFLEK
jgi:hypothetical protein